MAELYLLVDCCRIPPIYANIGAHSSTLRSVISDTNIFPLEKVNGLAMTGIQRNEPVPA